MPEDTNKKLCSKQKPLERQISVQFSDDNSNSYNINKLESGEWSNYFENTENLSVLDNRKRLESGEWSNYEKNLKKKFQECRECKENNCKGKSIDSSSSSHLEIAGLKYYLANNPHGTVANNYAKLTVEQFAKYYKNTCTSKLICQHKHGLEAKDNDSIKDDDRFLTGKEWIEDRSKPRKCCDQQLSPKISITRFNKPGPMHDDDWIEFLEWAKYRAQPKELVFQESQISEKSHYDPDKFNEWATKNAVPKRHSFPELECKLPNTKYNNTDIVDWDSFERWVEINGQPKRYEFYDDDQPVNKLSRGSFSSDRLESLSTPLQRRVRGKFIPPPKENHNFMPQISRPRYRNVPPRKTTSAIVIPHCFIDRIAESNFMRDLRFPVSKNALKYVITPRIIDLTLPKGTRHTHTHSI